MKHKWIASISPNKRASRDAYNREARRVVKSAQMQDWWCPIADRAWGEFHEVECIHHARGKNSEALRHDKRGWFLASLTGHRWIDRNRKKARELGFLCPLGKWGTPFKPDEPPMPGSVADLVARGILKI